MRKILAVLLIPFVLVACGDNDRNDTDTTASTDDAFISVVQDTAPEARLVDDQLLIDLAKANCDMFSAGGTLIDASRISLDAGLSPELAGSVIGAGIPAYCPEHSDLLN